MTSKGDALCGRMKHLLSAANKDCFFRVGKENGNKEALSAHKLILLSASDVFEAMFEFDTQSAKRAKTAAWSDQKNPVEVIDVEPEAFKAMLSFIYADDLSGLNGENVFAVLYAAKKYAVTPLVKACTDFPISALHDVFHAVAESRILGEEGFARHCMEHIDKNADNLLQTEQFLQIDQHLLCDILERDQLISDGGEIEIWNAALRWVDAQCRQNGIECSAENRRAQLGLALYKIRFRLIPEEEFTAKIVPSSVLNSDEIISVYISYHTHPTAPSLYPLRFPIERRALLPVATNGQLMLKIEQFSVFARLNENKKSQSPLHMAGFEWSILAFSRTHELTAEKYLDLVVQCNNPEAFDCDESVWNINCVVTIQILSQKNGADCRTLNNVFSESDPNLAYNFFIKVEHLMNPRNGLCCNDTVTLCVDLTVEGDE